MWTATPSRSAGSRLAIIVTRPSIQVGPRLGHGERVPAQAIGRQRRLARPGREQGGALVALIKRVRGARPHPVEPGTAILGARRGEGGAGQLLGIETESGALRRIAPLGQRAGHRLAREVAAEARHHPGLIRFSHVPSVAIGDCAPPRPAISRAHGVRNRPAPARVGAFRPGTAADMADLGLLPAARRRHLVVRGRADRVRAPGRDRRRDPPERQPRDRLRTICPPHAGGGGSGHPLCRRPLCPRQCRQRVRRRRPGGRRSSPAMSRGTRPSSASASSIPPAMSSPLRSRGRCPGPISPTIRPSAPISARGDDGRLHVSRPVYAPLVNQNVIWLTRRLNHPDGAFAGRDRDQHPARAIHRFLSRRRGQSAGRHGR